MKGQDDKGNVQPSSVLTLALTKSAISAVRIIRQNTNNIFFKRKEKKYGIWQ